MSTAIQALEAEKDKALNEHRRVCETIASYLEQVDNLKIEGSIWSAEIHALNAAIAAVRDIENNGRKPTGAD